MTAVVTPRIFDSSSNNCILSLETRAADLRRRLTQKDAELAGRVEQAKQAVAKDLEEKYAADRVSYQAMAKRLELEKLKTAGKP